MLRRLLNGLYLPGILIGLGVHASHDLVDSVGLIIVFEIVYFFLILSRQTWPHLQLVRGAAVVVGAGVVMGAGGPKHPEER